MTCNTAHGIVLQTNLITDVEHMLKNQLKKNNKFQVHAEALVNWRRGDEVLELLIEWVRKEVDSPTPVRPNHGVQFREPDTDKPSLQKTINMANFILDNETTRMILLKKNMAQIIELTQSTAQVLNLIQDKMGEDVDISEQRIDDYSSLVGLHFKLNVVLGLQKKDLIEKFEDLISWVDVQLVPVILREQPCSLSSLRLAERCTEEVLAVLEGVLLTGQVDEKFLKRVLDFLLQIIPNLNLADRVLDIQREIANLCFNNEFLEMFDEVVPVNFVNLLKVYSQKGDKLEPDQTKVIKSKILKFIRLYLKISKLDSSTKDALKDLVETVSLAVFQAADLELQKTDTLVLMDRFNNIEQEKPCLEILRSATVHNLISILEDNIAFTKIFHQVITEAIPEKEDFKMLFIYLCLLANMPQQTREKFLESIKTRIEQLTDKESEELEEYEEECTQVLNILAL